MLETMLTKLGELCVSFGGKLVAAILVLVIGVIAIKAVIKMLLTRTLNK